MQRIIRAYIRGTILEAGFRLNLHEFFFFLLYFDYLATKSIGPYETAPVYATVPQHGEVEHASTQSRRSVLSHQEAEDETWEWRPGHWHRVTTLGLVIRYSFSASPSCVSTLSCLSDLAAGWTRLALSTVERDSNRETAGD